MPISITIDNKVWQKIRLDLLKNQDTSLQVGWFDSSYGSENNNLPHAYVASLNEEGSSTNPARPFMRVGFVSELKSEQWQKRFKQSVERVLTGKSSFVQQYTLLGVSAVVEVKSVMNSWSTPPNSPRTVAQKGFNDPLIDTGELRDSVTFKIGKD